MGKLTVAFRVDANSQIGFGHFSRCLTLALALKKKCKKIIFLSQELPEFLLNKLLINSFEYCRILPLENINFQNHLKHSDWLNNSQAKDSMQIVDFLSPEGCDLLVVDHYAIDFHWERSVKKVCKKLLVIDDLADRAHECDIFLDQNLSSEDAFIYDGLLSTPCVSVYGPKYALMRPEFAELRSQHNGCIDLLSRQRIMVSMGGGDPNGMTVKILKLLTPKLMNRFLVDVVMGSMTDRYSDIEAICKNKEFNLHFQVENIHQLVDSALLVIGAGGISAWERCSLGVPSLMVSLADNQVRICKQVERAGAGVYLGHYDEFNAELFQLRIQDILHDNSRLISMSKSAYDLVDGKGAERLTNFILSFL